MGASPSKTTNDQPIGLTPRDRCPILPYDTSLLHQHLQDALSPLSTTLSSSTNRTLGSIYMPKALVNIILEYSRDMINHIISIDRYQIEALHSIGWISS